MSRDDKPVKSAERVLNVLELLAGSGRSMSHAEIARRMSIPKGSLTPLLRNLVARGYVDHHPGTAHFSLGESTYVLARHGAHSRDLVRASREALEHLVAVTNESAGLSVLRNDMAERIAAVKSERAMLYSMHTGVLQPLYASSAGKILLAWMPTAEREIYLESVRIEVHTNRTISSKPLLRRQLQQVRDERVAFSFGEFTSGVAGISVPVLDAHARAIAAVGVVLPLAEFEARRDILVDALNVTARQIARSALSA